MVSKTQQATLADDSRVKEVPPDYEGQLGNGAEIPTVIESRNDGDEERCPYCGEWKKGLTNHWSQSSCSYPPVSEYKIELMRGMLLGDSYLYMGNNKPMMTFGMTNKRFLKWLQCELGWLACSVLKTQTASDSAEELCDNLNRDTSPEDCLDIYRMSTRSHPCLGVFESWYDDGEKVFPRDLSLTPMGLKMWYVCDGCCSWSNKYSQIIFVSLNESDRPQSIISLLEGYGFTVWNSDTHFGVSTEDTEDFFDIIGDPVPGFEYKWAHEDHNRYERLVEECREQYCTQTLEDGSESLDSWFAE